MADIALQASGLSKTYTRDVVASVHLQDRLLKWRLQRKKRVVHALNNVSLMVQKGEWVGIYGQNGSGKTTLLKMLAGLLQPDTGSIRRRGSISSFFELGIGFHPERNADENIYLHGLLQGYSRKEIRQMTTDIIRFAGVESHIDLPLKCYSTGMQMRLAYAAAAQIDRDIYLFDEVFAVGDSAFQYTCIEHMRSMRSRGKTVIIVAHDWSLLTLFCDRILTMEHGHIMAEHINDVAAKVPQLEGMLRDLRQNMLLQGFPDPQQTQPSLS